MATTAVSRPAPVTLSRGRAMGIFFLIIGIAIFGLFVLNSEPGQQAKFGLNPGGRTEAIRVADLVLPVQPTLYLLTFVCIALAAWQLARGFKAVGWVLGIVVFCFVAAFLVWATRDKSFNLVGMLSASVLRATPIALGALSGLLCERSAVINIAIEGMMLGAAMVAVVVGTVTHNLYLGLLAAILTGGLMAALHAVLSIKFKVDQIVSGTAINILATGATSYISARFLQENTNLLNNSGTFPIIFIPVLSRIPLLGPIFFESGLIVYLMLILLVVVHVMLFYTRWGLRSRAVGEHPRAADTLGIDVLRVRYINVILGGMVAGIGGAYFTIGSVGRFDEVMTAGKGFIGLAAMIFGKWTPFGAFGSSLIFGFADALQVKLQILRVPIPSEFLIMAPYIATIIAIAGVVGRTVPPAADGQPYEKE
jgi:ABC-type uncharacterized transport system permease subunit